MEKKKRKLQYVTLIWEELPTDIKIFVIPRSELRKEDIAMLKACHRNYVGATGRFTELVSSTQSIDRSLILLHNKITNPDADWITKSSPVGMVSAVICKTSAITCAAVRSLARLSRSAMVFC